MLPLAEGRPRVWPKEDCHQEIQEHTSLWPPLRPVYQSVVCGQTAKKGAFSFYHFIVYLHKLRLYEGEVHLPSHKSELLLKWWKKGFEGICWLRRSSRFLNIWMRCKLDVRVLIPIIKSNIETTSGRIVSGISRGLLCKFICNKDLNRNWISQDLTNDL